MKSICKKVIGLILITILITNTNIVLAVTQSEINAQKQQQQENSNKQQQLEEEQERVQQIKDQTLKEVEDLNRKITDYQSQIEALESQIDEANRKIKEAEQQLAQKEQEHKEQEELIKKRMVAIYQSGETSYLDFLLSSSSLSDFISSYYLVEQVTQMDADLLEKIEKQQEEIEASKKQIETSKNELTTAKASKESVAFELKTAKSEKNAKVSQLSAEEQQLQKQIEEIQQANIAINKKIQAMQEELKKLQQQQQNNSGNSSPSSGTSSVGFIKPVNSYITTGLYYSSGSYHGAVDYGASNINGQPIYAVADGIVVTTQALTTSYGNYIILYHPASNLYTLYAHGQPGSIAVSELQAVKQGQQIMRVGNSGNSTGPHLHFEVRTAPGYYSNRVDPRPYLPK